MNTFGNMFRVTTWGESHGKAVGAVIDGCPAGLPLDEAELTAWLQKTDRPLEALATARMEQNNVQILSGVNKGMTIGTPLSLLIENRDYKKKDYSALSSVFRPGHGDYTWFLKHNIGPQSGGGRASGRECISRLAAGFIAGKIILNSLPEYRISSSLVSLAGIRIKDAESLDMAVARAVDYGLKDDSTGGEVRVCVEGIPGGLGEPVFGRLDADLAGAMMSIGGVKAVEIGIGREAACTVGSMCNDGFQADGDAVGFSSNNAGGILGGISSGAGIVITLAVKPTPSIARSQSGLGTDGKIRRISVKGRHDRNIAPRVAVIAEAMAALVLLDHLMLRGIVSRDILKKEEQWAENLNC